ncbi:MAG TPA: triple tyrosine motif-containing protein [Longimicrobiaceae bacterium]|jgi:signal transduction histidine kinase/ligand-binding sensor domain-containing protein
MSARCLLAAALACCACAPGLAQSPDLGQYAHTAWRVRDGAPGAVRSFAQGADGVLWIGSEQGLFQYDGVRFERFESPPGQARLPLGVFSLLALPDTSLWIGHLSGGVSVLHRGKVVAYGMQDGLPRGSVTAIARDSAGSTWAATGAGLARLRGRRWEEAGPRDGYPRGLTLPVLVDRRGAVWAGNPSGYYVLRPGATRFERRVVTVAGRPGTTTGYLTMAPDGSLWAAGPGVGLFLVADAGGNPPPPDTRQYPVTGLNGIWTVGRGHPAVAFSRTGTLVRVWLSGTANGPGQGPAADGMRSAAIPFSRAAGMSGDVVTAALYDREGTLWVGTPTGIDRFRPSKLTPVVWPEPVQDPAVVADTNGAVWASARNSASVGLFTIGGRVVPRPDGPRNLACLYRDLDGGIWLGGDGVWERKGAAFVSVPLPVSLFARPSDNPLVQAIARDRDGRLWVALTVEGVYRRSAAGAWERFGPRQGLDSVGATVITTDSAGRTWLGYGTTRQVAMVVGDSVRVLTAADGLAVGGVLAISVHGNRVWVAGDSGVAALDPRRLAGRGGRRFAALRLAGEPLRGVSGIVETADGELWLNGTDGVTRIPAAEVRRVLTDPDYRARYERFDHRDGIEPPAPQARPLPSAVAGTDGRIWFTTRGGVSWVDPRRVPRNTVPPPVQLRAFTAGGQRWSVGDPARDTLRLPPRTTPLAVAYAAYSLAIPERVRFRYRLEGFDTAWQDAGGRREAFYTNLPPGSYRFRVVAANDDGVWNTAGASLAFTIEPAWNQTWWFRALAAALLVLAPAAAAAAWQRRRARRAAERAQARFEAMLAERTRVARELHDTLLGDMAGVAMQLSAGARRVEASGTADREVVELLAGLGAQVQRALAEARRSVTGMRAAPEPLPPLHERLADAARRAFAGTAVAVRVEHTGSPRPLAPGVEAEILGIAAEALSNARRHAECRSVAVACDYAPRELRVRVRDDGRGFDPSRPPPAGHWGLAGMRERAASVGATLAVASAPGAGTEVALVLPAGKRRRRWWPRLAAALAACTGLAGPARAQAPSLAEMDRAAWTARDGAPQGVTALAQAPDGTLWVGTDGGLYNFDGRTFAAFQPTAGDPQLPPETVRSLLVARDGTLWIGFYGSGVARVARGRVTIYRMAGELPLNTVDQIREARDGSIWAINDLSGLFRFSRGDTAWRAETLPPEAAGARVGGLYIDSSDALWLAQGGRMFRRQLPRTAYAVADVPADVVFGFAETPGGDIWMADYDMRADHGRLQRFDRAGRVLASLSHPGNASAVAHTADGSLVVALDGVLRRYRADALTGRTALPLGPATDSYGSAPGVRGSVRAVLPDSDHNIWIGGRRGLERLRAPRLVPFRPGGMDGVWTLCAGARGDVFLSSTLGEVSRVAGGVVRRLPVTEGQGVSCGNDGVTRVFDARNLWEVHGERLQRVPLIPGLPPYELLQVVATSDHTLYAMVGGSPESFGGLWRSRDGRWSRVAAEGVLRGAGFTAYVDGRDRLWVGYNRGRIGRPLDGRVLSSGTPGLGSVLAILETPHGLFAAGTYGLAVLRDTSFQMLRFADRASTLGVAGLVESGDGDLYLNAVQGIVRVRAAELRAGLADPRYPMKSERVTEGEFTGPARVSGSTTTAARAADGTLWFSMLNGVVRYDPDAPRSPGRPPILSIRSITADRVPLGERGTFDPQPGTLAIRYFGVNLTAPDRVRYRYRLEGFDREWQEAGGRTEAIYTRPPPGTYTFRVMAANERGEWTAPVASVPFTVLPSFWQTRWFAVLAAAALAALAWLAYTLRVRSITAVLRARFDATLAERTRVARELHDTLLGDMAGLAMQLAAGARRVEASGAADREVVQLLAGLGAQVQRALAEARSSVTAMRAAPERLPPLHERLEEAARRAFAGTAVVVHVEHSGVPRPYPPAAEAEVLAVAAEALSNARRHAECRGVTVACDYGPRELRVRVRDDGRGFDPARPAPAGHWGLAGMRERAASVGATLAVASAPGAGTEVALVLPAGERRRKGWTRLLRPGRG